jgi:hypothetical protein
MLSPFLEPVTIGTQSETKCIKKRRAHYATPRFLAKYAEWRIAKRISADYTAHIVISFFTDSLLSELPFAQRCRSNGEAWQM